MLVLAPDPRSGIAPERVARVRALVDSARLTEGPASGTTVPGIVVALPGGADGVLDAVVLRPDGVLGLVPVRARVTAGSPATEESDGSDGSAGSAGSAGDASDPTEAAEAELERLLALPEPAVTAPRRALPAAEPGTEATRSALTAPVGSFRVLDAGDVRRVLTAFRLAEHIPTAEELSRAGFPTRSSSPSIPQARSAPASHPSLPPVPVTEPVPQVGRNPERDGGTASFPATGALALDPSRPSRPHLPHWAWGWPGLVIAAVAAFLLALGLAFGVGTLAGGSPGSATVEGGVTRAVDGVSFTRRDAALDATCEGHAYGRVVAFVRERPCVRLERSLWTGTVGGHQMLVAVATVTMADPASAGALKSLVDSSGTGNVSELVREGRGYPGAPTTFTSAGYASMLLGSQVVISEADASDPSFGDAATLNRIASGGLALR